MEEKCTLTMSHLYNPVATAEQIYRQCIHHHLPADIQDSIRYNIARLTSTAGFLLRLPQNVTAQANVLIFRYWLVDDILQHEFSVGLSWMR